jgi:hypothetical protein
MKPFKVCMPSFDLHQLFHHGPFLERGMSWRFRWSMLQRRIALERSQFSDPASGLSARSERRRQQMELHPPFHPGMTGTRPRLASKRFF